MIKIQLLPPYILERRRVKALAVLVGFVLIVEVVLFGALLWAPVPTSYKSKLANAEKRRDKAYADQADVENLQSQVDALKASYGAKQTWVNWVDEADARPAQWVAYFKRLNEYFPADVVVNGLPLPSGNTLNLSGSTTDLMAAARWYLNMLRCDMVNPDIQSVQFNPGTTALNAANPRMATPVSISVSLKPELLDFMAPVATPSGITSGGRVGGGGRMGGGGGGRGGGMRGGGGGRGGGGRGGGGRGGGGPRGGRRGG
jgi:Tfp pilus assembly protein PilN